MKKIVIFAVLLALIGLNSTNIFSQEERSEIKKYDLQYVLSKDLKFVKTTTMEMKSEGEFINEGKKESYRNADSEIQKFGYTILEVKEGKTLKLKIELLENTRKSSFEPASNYDKQQKKLMESIKNEWLIVKYSAKGYEIVETSKKLAELMKPKAEKKGEGETEKKNEGGYPEKTEPEVDVAMLLNDYLKYEVINKPLFSDFTPKKTVAVGESWLISMHTFHGIEAGIEGIEGEGENPPEVPGADAPKDEKKDENEDKVKFTLEKVESKDDLEIATITFIQKMESSDSFKAGKGIVETMENTNILKGTILFDVRNKRILSSTFTFESNSTSLRNKKQCGKSSMKHVTKSEYKYTK